MFGYEKQLLNPLRTWEYIKLWGVVFLAGFLLGTVQSKNEPMAWTVKVTNEAAHARNAQDFYEALFLAENGDQNISTIYIDDDFAIRGDTWSPQISVSKNLTIIGGRANVQVCVSKSTVIMSIQKCHVVVKGLTLVPVDSRYEGPQGNRQSEHALFELDEEATIEFKDMVLEVASVFKLTNRPVELSHSDPGFTSNVKEVDEAVIFLQVVMPPVTYTNVSFQHKDFKVLDTDYRMLPTMMKSDSRINLAEMVEEIPEDSPHHIDVLMDSETEISSSDSNNALVSISKVITITQTKRATLFLDAKTKPGTNSGLPNLTPEGRLHFEAAALEISSENGPPLVGSLQSYFPIINYPDVEIGPRCLVSLRRSFVLVKNCADLSGFRDSMQEAYLLNYIQLDSTKIRVQYFIGSGLCMDNVTVSCSRKGLSKFFAKRAKRKQYYGLALSPFQKSHGKKSSTDKSLFYVLIVLIVLVLVTVVAFGAILGNSHRSTLWLSKCRSRSGSGDKPVKNRDLVTVSVSTDEDEANYRSYRVVTCSNPTSDTIKSESISTEPHLGHLEPSKWTPAVGLTGADEEEVVVVEKRVGHGGYGVVYKGKWKGQEVAVKTLSFEQSSMSFETECPKRQRAILEAGIGSIVKHPNIVQTYSYTFELQERVLIQNERPRQLKMHMIQEYCEMGSLRMAMDDGRLLCRESDRPNLRFILQIGEDVAKGMSYLHERNIIHGDLSAKNILLQTMATSENKVIAKICDFGLSVKLRAADSQLQNCKAGTPLYMAPEVGKFGILSKKADIYSFGVVLWEAYNCSYKSWGKSAINGSVDFPLECPLQLVLLICWCLAPRPSNRPDFDEVLDALTTFAGHATGAKINERKEKKRIRKIAASTDVWSSHQIREFLLGGSKSTCELAPERLPTPRDNHVEICLSVQIVKLNQCERLSLTWHEYNQRACASQMSQLCLFNKYQSISIDGMEGLPQDKKSFINQPHLASESEIQRAGLHKSRSTRYSADADDLVAKVEWLAEMDSRGLGANDKNIVQPAHRRLGNNSADRISSQWRSASVGVSQSKLYPTRDAEDTIGTGV